MLKANVHHMQEELATLIEHGLLADTNSVSVNMDQSIGGEHANA